MGLNIKNPQVESDIRKLAELRGESLTEAIGHAVRAEIERCEKEKKKPFATTEEFVAYLRSLDLPENLTSDHSDLYDEEGMPI